MAVRLRRTRTRDDYIRPGSVPQRDPESGAVVYLYISGGRPYGQAFSGRRAKPVWHYAFRTEPERTVQISRFFTAERERTKARAERDEARRRPHSLEKGDILTASGGWEQTTVYFYQVLRVVSAHSVEIRQLESLVTPHGPQAMSGTTVPEPGRFSGPGRKVRADSRHEIRIERGLVAQRWDGKPRFCSWYG
jgi:hypothetical protein